MRTEVALTLEAGTTADSVALTPQPIAYDFIFGLGAEGLVPFERALTDRRVGEQISLLLDPHALQLPSSTCRCRVSCSPPRSPIFFCG